MAVKIEFNAKINVWKVKIMIYFEDRIMKK